MIQIDELLLRIPGMTEEAGRQLGQDVALGVATRLPDTSRDLRLDELNVQVTLAPGLDRTQITAAIVTQIVDQLQPATTEAS